MAAEVQCVQLSRDVVGGGAFGNYVDDRHDQKQQNQQRENPFRPSAFSSFGLVRQLGCLEVVSDYLLVAIYSLIDRTTSAATAFCQQLVKTRQP